MISDATDRGPSDACPNCGSHERIEFVDGLASCACGWSGQDEDLCYRVSQAQIEHACAQGDLAIALLEEELRRAKLEPQA